MLFRDALTDLEITPCIPGRQNGKVSIACDTNLYKQHNLVERLFGREMHWRRFHRLCDEHDRHDAGSWAGFLARFGEHLDFESLSPK